MSVCMHPFVSKSDDNVDSTSSCPTSDLRTGPLRSAYWVMKELFDRSLACTLLVLTAPLLFFLMILVRLSSRGPAIYSQLRVGKDGHPFRIYKIRTMHNDCEKQTGPVWAERNDPRVTGLGRWLRRSHLDELPQLINVLRGEMSFVGPRPERPELFDSLQQQIPLFHLRVQVKPGVTGLAQIRQESDRTIRDVRRKLRYDLLYIRKSGLWLDVKLMIATFPRIFGSRFGYLSKQRERLCSDVDTAKEAGAESGIDQSTVLFGEPRVSGNGLATNVSSSDIESHVELR